MKAIILNSGCGSRMGELTAHQPKCLIDLEQAEGAKSPSKTILNSQLSLLREFGIERILITTGYCAAALRSHVISHFPDLTVEYVFNPRYRETNTIYSLHLANQPPHAVDDDVLLLHGDMVFEREALRRLLAHPAASAVVVKRGAKLPEKDFRARIHSLGEGDWRVRQVSVDLVGVDCVPLFPIYKLSRAFYSAWAAKMAEFVARGETAVYAEEALNRILVSGSNARLAGLELAAVSFRGFCMEVDTQADLRRARILQAANRARRSIDPHGPAPGESRERAWPDGVGGMTRP